MDNFDSLPQVFKDRINKFRRNNKAFAGSKFELTEIFICREALRLANRFKTVDALLEYNQLPKDEQRKCVSSKHNPSTFGLAVRLAALYVGAPDKIENEHGLGAPLMGCEEYGCHPAIKRTI